MYLHVGNNYVVRCDEIIGIFDIRNKRTNIYRFFLKPRLGTDQVIDLTGGFPCGQLCGDPGQDHPVGDFQQNTAQAINSGGLYGQKETDD